jgi:hypothetical protein
VPPLIEALQDDRRRRVRFEAADALTKIGDDLGRRRRRARRPPGSSADGPKMDGHQLLPYWPAAYV